MPNSIHGSALRSRVAAPTRGKSPAGVPKPGPGYDGRLQEGIARVDDPFEPGAKRAVVVNLHDVLIQWRARRAIDESQFEAGRWFQALYKRAMIGAVGALQYDKTRVDGGYPMDPLSAQVMEASEELQTIAVLVGVLIDFPLLCRVLGAEVPLAEEAKRWDGESPERYVARRLRTALHTIADHRGATGPQRAKMRAWRA